MKVALVFLLACCLGGALGGNTLLKLIKHEVDALLATDKNLTVGACTDKCDALFDLLQGHDEKSTDKMCHTVCQCKINPLSCVNTTHKPHHSHGTHGPTTPMPTAMN